MPLPPVPENATARIWLDYTSKGKEHSLLVRPATDLALGERQTVAQAFATVMASRMSINDSVFAARYSGVNTDFSTPFPFTPVQGVVSGALVEWVEDPESAFISLVARSTTTGRRVRYTLYTPIAVGSWPVDNRYNPGEQAVIDTWRINMTSLIEGGGSLDWPMVASDGTFVNVYGYVNLGKNSYWQRKQRRTGG